MYAGVFGFARVPRLDCGNILYIRKIVVLIGVGLYGIGSFRIYAVVIGVYFFLPAVGQYFVFNGSKRIVDNGINALFDGI